VSSIVTGKRSRISVTTGLPVRHEVPRSPWPSAAIPAAVLAPPRLVQAEEALQLGDHRRAGDGVGADHLLDHGAGHQTQHQEHEHREADQSDGHRVQPDGDVAPHRAVYTFSIAAPSRP
jgi:hypothetical protein